jgi:hypothetical protein
LEKIKHVKAKKPEGIMDLHIRKECIKRLIQNRTVMMFENNELISLLKKDKETHETLMKEQQYKTYKKKEIEKSRIIKVKVSRKVKREVNISPSKTTICINCSSNCHDPCYLDGIYDKGSVKMQNCWCII